MSTILIFDYDDTLVQTRECKFAALRALGRRLNGTLLTDDSIASHWGKPYRQFFGDLFAVDGARLDQVLRQYELLDAEFPMKLHADAERMMRDLLPGRYCGIVSSASSGRIVSQLAGLDVTTDLFRFVQGAEHTDVHKPDPRVFGPALAAIRRDAGKTADIIYVGDSLGDCLAAQGAGLRFIGIPRHAQSRTQLAAAGAEIIGSLDELHAAL